MYNRFVYQRDSNSVHLEKKIASSLETLRKKHQKANLGMAHHYKARVNDFLVQMASHPIQLGVYQPPIKHITRSPQRGKMINDPQLYINGFKTNKQRIQKAITDQKILDLSPTTKINSQLKFRPRVIEKQIQGQMRFQNKSKSMINLPRLTTKMHFKAIQQFGNNLQSMKLNQFQLASLVNRLQTIAGPTKIDPLEISTKTLQRCNLLKTKHISTQ